MQACCPPTRPTILHFQIAFGFKQSKLSETKNTLFIASFFFFFLRLAGIKNIEKLRSGGSKTKKAKTSTTLPYLEPPRVGYDKAFFFVIFSKHFIFQLR
jgi:hypothetical protein